MKKIAILQLTFFSIFLTLLSILLSYFGIIRYILLHRSSCSSYIPKFKQLNYNDNQNIIISITTSNLKHITPTINSILDQTIKVNKILLIIPPTLNNEVTKDIKNVVSIYNITKDYNNLNSIVPPLLHIEDEDTILISIKDNMVYGKDFIEDMMQAHEENGTIIYAQNKYDPKGILIKPNYLESGFENTTLNEPKEFVKQYSKVMPITINYSEIYKSNKFLMK